MNRRLRLAPWLLAAAPALSMAFIIIPPVDTNTYAQEFTNAVTGQYVMLADAAEVANGRAGPGWISTGHRFVVPKSGGEPVCRFYAPVSNAHFHTATPAECEGLKVPGSGWIYEGIAFHARTPGAAGCGAGDISVYRVYLDRPGRPVHRYVRRDLRDRLLARGWIDEGVAFCSEKVEHAPERSVFFNADIHRVAAEPQCPADGVCVMPGNLPSLDRQVAPYLAPRYFDRNPEYPADVVRVTGDLQDLRTFVTSSAADEVLRHSYVGAGGVHLNSADRLGGDLASFRVAYRPPAQAAPLFAASDLRPNAWQDGIDRDIHLSVMLRLKLIERSPGAHAYGHHSLVFRDRGSGGRIDVTVQAFGTMAPGDFVAPGAEPQRVIVSTVLGPTPRFGSTDGAYADCSAGCGDGLRVMSFRMARDDMLGVIALARQHDARLSGDVRDYDLEWAEFKVETFGNARLGVQVGAINFLTHAN